MSAPSPAVIDEIDGRDVRIGERWLADFASCDWLGLGLDEEIIDAIPYHLARWGTGASWAFGGGATGLSAELEAELIALVGAEDCLLAPSLRHLHAGAIPALAAGGTLFLEDRAGPALRDGCAIAQARGATIIPFRRTDPDELAARLSEPWRRPGLICADGVHGLTGRVGGLLELAGLARAHGAALYIDDAHGLGVLGEHDPSESCPYGIRGSGLVNHAGLGWNGVILAASLAGALCAPLAVLACPSPVGRTLRGAARTWREPVSVMAVATALEGLRVCDRRGERLRARVYELAAQVTACAARLGAAVPGTGECGFPIVALGIGETASLGELRELLLERGICAATASVPRRGKASRAWLRLQVTAANTDGQIEHLEAVLADLTARF
ncbi:MAG: aminotransferase class I/II-fold pyridoxal phosphate-dependent enzyme, partial [Solirubrobacteraceae bacterium]